MNGGGCLRLVNLRVSIGDGRSGGAVGVAWVVVDELKPAGAVGVVIFGSKKIAL